MFTAMERFKSSTWNWKKLLLTGLVLIISAFSLNNASSDVHDISDYFRKISPLYLLLSFSLIYIANIVSTFRLQSLLVSEGWLIDFKRIHRVNILSLLSGALFLNFIGQSLSRVKMLKAFNISSQVIVGVTFIERLLGAFLLGVLSVGALSYLLWMNKITIDAQLKGDILNSIFCLFWVGICVYIFLKKKKIRSAQPNSLQLLLKVSWRPLFYTLLSYTLMLLSYMLTLKALGVTPDHITQVLCALLIIMFIASLPISLNGWGVREYASIFFLGLVGVSSPFAFVASLLTGILSFLTLIVSALLHKMTLPLKREVSDSQNETIPASFSLTHFFSSMLFFLFPLGFFISIEVSLSDVTISFLPLDMLVIFSLLFVWPTLAINKKIRLYFIATSVVFLFSFLIGWLDHGMMAYALRSRLLGWFMLWVYAAVGLYFGQKSEKNNPYEMLKLLLLFCLAVAFYDLMMRWVQFYSGTVPMGHSHHMLKGLLANRNAFAYVVLMVIAVVMSYARTYHWFSKEIHFNACLGFLSAIVFFTGSRTSFVTLVALMLVALLFRVLSIKSLIAVVGIFSALVGLDIFVLSVKFLFELISSGAGFSFPDKHYFFPGFSTEDSMVERWRSIHDGFNMFLSSPVWGKGLGAFMHQELETYHHPLVIHNTFVWILAEFGLIGLGVFLFFYFKLFHFGWNLYKKQSQDGLFILLLLTIFTLFALPHDIFYQRIHWFLTAFVIAVATRNKDIVRNKG